MKNLPHFLSLCNIISTAAHHFIAARDYFLQDKAEGLATFCIQEEKELWALHEEIKKHIWDRGGEMEQKPGVPAIPMNWPSIHQVLLKLKEHQVSISDRLEEMASQLIHTGNDSVGGIFISEMFRKHLSEVNEIEKLINHMYETSDPNIVHWDRELLKQYGKKHKGKYRYYHKNPCH